MITEFAQRYLDMRRIRWLEKEIAFIRHVAAYAELRPLGYTQLSEYLGELEKLHQKHYVQRM